MRIGVLSDTHIPDRTDELPDDILTLFHDVELILHAGDVCVPAVLDRLRSVAPVVAVRGNRDKPEIWPGLPEKTIVEAGTWRIGLIHGTRPRLDEVGDRLRYLRGNYRFLEQRQSVQAAFAGETVHCIVFGHTHQVCNEVEGTVLLFNPGGVVRSWRGGPSSVGFLEIGGRGIRAYTVPLRRSPRTWTIPEQISRWPAKRT